MRKLPFNFSRRSWTRVVVLTVLGTACCIAIAIAFDSFSFTDWHFRWGTTPQNNVIIPLIIAPPFFFYLLSKLRELAIAHDRLMIIASTDSLTSCLNRAAFTTLVEAYLDRVAAEGHRKEGALLVIDVDHFKRVNDRFGHDCGDEALKLIASTIRETTRDTDLVARIGGEEFTVFLPASSMGRARAVAERIRKSVSDARFSPEGISYDLTVSVGAVVFGRLTSFTELYRRADLNLYEAKRNGRNRVEFSHLEPAPLPIH